MTSRASISLVLLAGVSLTACETSSPTHHGSSAGANGLQSSTPVVAELPPPPVSLVEGRATYGDLEEASGESHTMTVGLYGEVDPNSTPRAGSEGEGNLRQISFAPEGGDFTPDIDRSGSFLVYASKQHSERFDLYRKSIEGRTVTQLTADESDDIMPVLSPDGANLAFSSNRNGNWDVFVMPASGGPATQMTFESDDEVQPTWSPDGKQLAFARMNKRTSRWEIWMSNALVPSSATYLTDGFLPRWCPDPKQTPERSKLLFQRARQQGSRLYSVWTIDLMDGEAANPTEIVTAQNAAIIQPNWSPDGMQIVFTTVVEPGSQGSELPERSDLWVVNVDGTGRRMLTSGPFRNMQPVWGPDAKVYFVSNRSGIENLWAVSVREGGHGAVPGGHMANESNDGHGSESHVAEDAQAAVLDDAGAADAGGHDAAAGPEATPPSTQPH
ncbi:MAG: PD40 domain-containing protein [Phycisphaerae bacterium]|nr:PD40 domain-containing protein [Phycisphaerae bacterium]